MTPELGKLYLFEVKKSNKYSDETLIARFEGWTTASEEYLRFETVASSLNFWVTSFGMPVDDFEKYCQREIRPEDLVEYVHLGWKTPAFDQTLKGG